MKQLRLKFAEPEDHEQVIRWLNANPANDFDSRILSYPTLQIVTAYNGHNVMHLPMHECLVLESLAVNPETTELERAQALRDVTKAATLIASGKRMKELYFMLSDAMVKEIATKKSVGFEIVTMARMRL